MPAERMIGNYVLGPILGRGGMSCVHAAAHRFLGDRVAIKLLPSQLGGDPDATAAFLAEATRTRAIDHPSVVRVIDFGRDGDDCYLVMELLDGDSLAARLERDGSLDEPETRRLGAAIADGVAAAHARGIVHRDLKPGNIMVVAGQPKIVDFGIARQLDRGAATVTGSRLGTLAYMAPEQLTGGLVAPCIDIWALGVILYEALAGRLPFDDFADGRSPQLFEAPPRLGSLVRVSPALDALVAACLEREPGKRPASMAAIAEALRAPAADQRFTEELAPSLARQANAPDDARPRSTDPARPRQPTSPAGTGASDPMHEGDAIAMPRRPRGRAVTRGALVVALAAVCAGGAIGVGWTLRARGDRTATAGSGSASSSAPLQLASDGGPETVAAGRQPITAGAAGSAGPRSTATPAASPSRQPPNPAGTTVTVELRSAPTGALVTVGGKLVGVTPATLALDVPASILVTRAGYQPLRVRAERAGPLDVRLVPATRTRRSRPVAGETLD